MNEHIQRKYNQDLNKQLISITSVEVTYQGMEITRYEKFRYYISEGIYRVKSAWLVLIGKAEIEDY